MTNPSTIAEADAEEIPALLAHLAAVQAALAARLLRLQADNPGHDEGHDTLLDMKEAAALLGVSPHFTYELARQNRLPVIRLGHYVRIRRAALQRWLREREGGIAERRG